MKHQTFTLETSDGNNLFAQCWEPVVKGDKVIILIHGLGEHSSRYGSWASLFVSKGYAFLTMDLRGHGRSEGKKGHADSIDQLLDDIDLLYYKADELFPGYKKILYGHSMGGNLVLNHVIRRNRPLYALVVTSPWLKLVKEPSPTLVSITSFLGKFMPSFQLPNGLRAEQISHDPEEVRKYREDPLNHDRISLRMATVIINAGLHALRNVYKINYPFLIMHGRSDSITSSKASEEYVRNTSKRTHLKLWDHQYHELHNEFVRMDVFNYISTWIENIKTLNDGIPYRN